MANATTSAKPADFEIKRTQLIWDVGENLPKRKNIQTAYFNAVSIARGSLKTERILNL